MNRLLTIAALLLLAAPQAAQATYTVCCETRPLAPRTCTTMP